MPWPSIPAGDLRHIVNIDQRASTQDAAGGVSTTWNTIQTTRARIVSVSYKEQTQADKMTSVTTHLISLRYNAAVTITPGMRVNYGTRNFEIQSVNNVEERNLVLQLSCAEIIN